MPAPPPFQAAHRMPSEVSFAEWRSRSSILLPQQSRSSESPGRRVSSRNWMRSQSHLAAPPESFFLRLKPTSARATDPEGCGHSDAVRVLARSPFTRSPKEATSLMGGVFFEQPKHDDTRGRADIDLSFGDHGRDELIVLELTS